MAKAIRYSILSISLGIVAVAILLYFSYQYISYKRFLYHIYTVRPYTRPAYTATPVLTEDARTFTWLIHMYPPIHNAGAEWMAHAMNKALLEGDCAVNVVLNDTDEREFERVQVIDKRNTDLVESSVTHCAALISHLDMEIHAVKTAIAAKRPLVLVMHNNYRSKYLREFKAMMPKNLYIIHNSKWLQAYYSSFDIPSIIVYPPVSANEYATETSREYVTLINLNYNKGGNVLVEIAKRMPDVQFLGVQGGYDSQIKDTLVTNIRYIENTSYIKDVYKQTDILLVPSKEESWGRVAVEAMSSGIPVIANPTPGLVESCGSAGIFCARDDIAAWVSAIRRLKDDSAYYAKKSADAKARAKELEPARQLKEMREWLLELKWRD